MKIVAGLGNPGPKYETTRHNAGFLLLDRLIDRWSATGPVAKNEAETWNASVKGEKVILVKPQTYMNLSGRSVGPLFQFFKCEPEDLIIAHDDVDLEPLTMRVKTGGGTGGHNGLKSVDEAIGKANNGYHRVRIGVGKHPRIPTPDWVLKQFTNTELKDLDLLLDRAAEAVELLIEGKAKEAMNEYNRKVK